MANPKNRATVEEALRSELERDRTKTYVVEISPLGLVEMTRQNVTDGPREIMTRKCPTCGGDGIVYSEASAAIDVERRLRALAAGSRSAAVGKLDGFAVCVGDAAGLVGKKVKVRIERVLDGVAYATLVRRATGRAAAEPLTAEAEAEKPTRKPPARRTGETAADAETEAEAADEAGAAEAAEVEEIEEPAEPAATAEGEAAESGEEPGEDGVPKKKRTRRGTRGGRKRRKPAGASANGAEPEAAEPEAESEQAEQAEAERAEASEPVE